VSSERKYERYQATDNRTASSAAKENINRRLRGAASGAWRDNGRRRGRNIEQVNVLGNNGKISMKAKKDVRSAGIMTASDQQPSMVRAVAGQA
jgi:hypothetical protein